MADECRDDHRVGMGEDFQPRKNLAHDRVVDPFDSSPSEAAGTVEAHEHGLNSQDHSDALCGQRKGLRARVGFAWRRIIGSSPAPCATQPTPAARVLIEARGILAGRAADGHAARGGPMPHWTWLNVLAHRPPRAFRAIATAYPFGALTLTMLSIADELDQVSLADAVTIQTEVLLPAELTVLAGGDVSPGTIFKSVQRQVLQLRPGPGRS